MRSTFLHSAAVLGPLLLASALLQQACAEISNARSAGNADQSPKMDQPTTGGYSNADAATTSSAPTVRGNPLCGVTAGRCLPDDDGIQSDAGSAGASDCTTGCRLGKSEANGYAPTCFDDGADRRGADGATCQTGADCAPGFDCVEAAAGSVCRRYCCTGSCEGQTAQNGGATFCDIQKILDPDLHWAPVCMPIKSCKLLVPGDCGAHETCAVVTEKGVTGCVVQGSATEGESCDAAHCAVGLTCLGNPGDRRCYTLCRTEDPITDCKPTQSCTTGSVFQDNNIGVCKEN